MKILKIAALGMFAGALAGCASLSTPMTDFATDYNRVIADTRNEMILLNIVRARYREPTHYSTLSQVSGNIAVGGSAGFDLSGIIDDIDADAGVGLSIRSAPSFQIVPLNTRESANGILRPIEPNVVAIFLAQGWDEHQLAALLVESVTCGEGPDRREYQVDMRYSGEASENRLSRAQIFSMGFRRGPESNGEPAVMHFPSDQRALVETMLEHLDGNYSVSVRQDADGEAQFEVRERVSQVLRLTTGDFCGNAELLPSQYELRSVEGVIYFLGEALRDSPALRDDQGRVMFAVGNAPPAAGHSVHVAHNGRDWYVARHDGPAGDRSIQIVSLISQLISLQTSSDVLQRATSTLTVN